MSIFNFWKRDDSSSSQPTTGQTTQEVTDPLLRAFLTNKPITRDMAMTVPAVSSAVDFISNTIASMPVKLYKYKEGSIEERYDDTRVKLLNTDTADTLSAFELKKAMVKDYLMGQGGYAYIRKNRNDATGLIYIPDDYVAPQMLSANPLDKKYTIYVLDREFELFEFVKILRNTTNGVYGVGLTKEVSKALETAYYTLAYQLGLVKSGGNKKGFLKTSRTLGQKEIDTLKQSWANMYKDNTENVVVLNNGLEFQESSNSSVEMQLDQNKKTLTDEINAIFHIYPNDYYRTFKEAIYPIVKAFETTLNRDLLLEREKNKMFFEFDVKEILRVDIKERYQAYKLAKETGFMTLNEIRRAENMDRIEGLDVVNVGLSAVLYDTNTHQYYTPNMDATKDLQNIQKEIVDHDVISEEEKDGNIE